VQDSSFREAALWYPTVPEPELCLNEVSFTGGSPSSTAYRPLFWAHFGGPGGSYLKHVTGVSAYCPGGLYSLEFHYGPSLGLAGAYKLGRRRITDDSKILEFQIDGVGGELIETVEVTLHRYKTRSAHYSFLKYGVLDSVKVSYSYLSGEDCGFSKVGALLVSLPWCVIDHDKSQTILPCRQLFTLYYTTIYRDCPRNYPYRSLCKSGRSRPSRIEDECC